MDFSNKNINDILTGNNIVLNICNNLEYFLSLIPEIKSMIGFEHKHPHHHLDVWDHTLAVLENLNSYDLELNMAALFHDIGKPYCYQEGDVRHFNGHQLVSYEICIKVLSRLGYDDSFINRVSYLVRTHDSIINPVKLDNNYLMVVKRLRLQYADALAHHPDKVDVRIKYLDKVKERLSCICSEEIDDIFSSCNIKKKIKS